MRTTGRHLCLLVGLFGATASACGAYAVSPAPMPTLPLPAGAARVCLVRRGSEGALSTYPIRDNGVLVGATLGGSCFCYFAGEGHHEIEARSDGFDLLQLEVTAGNEYVLLQTASAAVGIVRSRLETMDPAEGKQALEVCQYSVLSEVPEGTYKAKPDAVISPK